MAGHGKKLGIGVLGAAAIARKNVKAIGKTTNGLGTLLAVPPPAAFDQHSSLSLEQSNGHLNTTTLFLI